MTTSDAKVRKMIIPNQVDKNGTAMIYIEQLSYDSNLKKVYKRIATGIRVKPIHWSKKKEEVLKGDEDSVSKNQIITEAFLKLISTDSKTLVKQSPKGIDEFFDEYIELRKASGSPNGTVKEFKTCQNRLKGYESCVGKKLYFKDINHTFSDSFNVWLYKQKYSSGTIEKTFAILRTFMNHWYSRRSELHLEMNDSFKEKGWKKGEKSINDPHPVTSEDYLKLSTSNLDSVSLEKTRDRFLFQISTGLRYGDAFTVKPSNIVADCIKINPSKTIHKKNNTVYINLNPLSESILKKYNYDMRLLKISNQKYNKSLQELCKACELSDIYTSHDGRDTFITNCINAGIDIPTILSWTGQESYEIMKRYFRIDEKKKAEDMKKIAVFAEIK